MHLRATEYYQPNEATADNCPAWFLADADNVEQCFTVAALTLAVISGPLFVVGYIVAVVY